MKTSFFLLALAGAFILQGAQAQVYRCLDKGQVMYSDSPCGPGKKTDRIVEVEDLPVNTGTAKGEAPAVKPFRKSPDSPTLTFYYDPAEEPPGITISQVESVIQGAVAAWNAGCNVNLVYGGLRRADVTKRGLLKDPEAPAIRWNGEMAAYRIPGTNVGAAGLGGSAIGVQLNPAAVNREGLKRVITHEIGHVIGIGHIHEDPTSVMSYLADAATRAASKRSKSDYLSCNLAIKQRYGIDFEMPKDARFTRMSDVEALQQKR